MSEEMILSKSDDELLTSCLKLSQSFLRLRYRVRDLIPVQSVTTFYVQIMMGNIESVLYIAFSQLLHKKQCRTLITAVH